MNTVNSPLRQSAEQSPERVPLPAQAPLLQPDLSHADLLLALFVVLLAFFLASTPARNSDLWLHVATGRAVADGSYRFQGDPFSLENITPWIAHSWLFDLAAYGLFTSMGGGVLVILKAILIAVLAALLVRLGTRDCGLAWPAVAAALAVLALSGRLLLQPALLSVLLLAVTLLLLERGRRLRSGGAGWLRAYGPLALLFALWANLDDWFLLGPSTAALYLIGEAIAAVMPPNRSTSGAEPSPPARASGWFDLVLTLAVGLFACLLTPFHIHGFTLPVELGLTPTAAALKQDAVLRNLFLSPFDETYFRSGLAWSIPGLAYLALAVLSGLSFLGSRDAWRSWRLPVWLGLFGLSAWSARAVPFFAVAAGPILALNVRDLTRRSRPVWLAGASSSSVWQGDFFARLGRAAALLLLLGLVIAAWPGWLQSPPYEMRRWVVLSDPSLREAAEKLAEWRKDGRLTSDDRGFNFSPEEANYFAWYCPEVKGLVDARLHISPEAAAEYVSVRRALLHPAAEVAGAREWRSILRTHRINHVIVYDSNPERVDTVFRHLAGNEAEWNRIALTGRAAIFRWKDPQHQVRELKMSQPLLEEAYQPSESRKAPKSWPGRYPEPPEWWRAFITARPASSADREEAALLLMEFDTRSEQNRRMFHLAWNACRLVAPLGAGAGAAGLPALAIRLQQALDLLGYTLATTETPIEVDRSKPTLGVLALAWRMAYLTERDDASPEYLWLAIRAARRALHENPNDAHAHLILGEAYMRLTRNTRERVWQTAVPLLRRIRQVQASTAFNQALLLQPDLASAHNRLTQLYQDMGLRDLAWKHRRELLHLSRSKGSAAGESRAEYEARLALLQSEEQRIDQEMKRVQDQFDANTAKYKIIDRAEDAVKVYGLGGKALELLLATDAASLGRRAIGLELRLLLSTGRVREVREWMSPDHRETLGANEYLEDRLKLAAASGDYEQAGEVLDEFLKLYDKPPHSLFVGLDIDITWRQAMALGVANEVLQLRLEKQTPHLQVPPERRMLFLNSIREFSQKLRLSADLSVLRGLLALERGDIETARRFLESAANTYQAGEGIDFGGRPMAEHFLKLLPKAPKP